MTLLPSLEVFFAHPDTAGGGRLSSDLTAAMLLVAFAFLLMIHIFSRRRVAVCRSSLRSLARPRLFLSPGPPG